MASNVRKGLVIAAGAIVIAGGVSVVHIWRRWIERRSLKLENRVEDGIGMEQLAVLAKSSNVNLRRSAEQLLLDRITRSENFKFVLLSCQSQDEEQVLKGCTVLCVILKSVDYRSFGVDKPILTTLANCLVRSLDRSSFTKPCSDTSFPERIQRMTLAAIFEFVCDSDDKKKILLQETDCVAAMIKLVQQTKSKEVLRYAVFLLHQMAKYASARFHLVKSDAIQVFACLSVSQHGDKTLQKLCFQILVILVNTPGLNREAYLKQIAKHRVLIRAAVSCKSDDGDLAYWAVALLHEFVVHTSTKQYLYPVSFLLGNLQKALVSSPCQLQRLILRVISFMSLHHDEFKSEVLNNTQLMGHIPVCLASGEPDVVQWGLILLHDLAVAGSDQEVADKASLEKLLGPSEDALIKALIPLAVSKDYTLVKLMAETLGFFCSCEQLHLRLVKAGALSIILGLAISHDPELTFWAAALLLNLAMTSDAVKCAILKAGGLQALVELALGDHENSQVTTMAAKTLVMLGITEEPLKLHFLCDNESGSVNVHDKNFYLNQPGVTVMVWDTLVSEEVVCQNFNEENCETIPDLTLDIPCLQEAGQNIGNLVFITIKGKHCTAYLQGLKDVLHFHEDCSFSGVKFTDPFDLPPNHMCAIVSRLSDSNRLDVWHMDKSVKSIDLQLQFSYGRIVNDRVRQLILSPLLKRLDSVPAHSAISRVSDLELLEILACHDTHLPTLKNCQGLLDILTDMMWYCAEKGLQSLDSEPLAVAHCLGALRVLAILSTHEFYQSELLVKDTVSAIVSLLFNLVNIWLSSLLRGPSRQSSATTIGRGSTVTTPILGLESLRPQSRGDAFATGGVLSGDDELDGDTFEDTADSLFRSQTLDDTISSVDSMVQQHAHFTSQQGRAEESMTVVDSAVYTELESDARTSDHQVLYRRVAKYASLVLSNLAPHQDQDVIKGAKLVLNKAGASHILWALLLCTTDAFKNVLSLPICCSLTRLAAKEFPPIADGSVVLDVADKTRSLVLSSDCLEVRNDNWTFESIRTNHALPKSCDESTAGWYYEVQLMTGGIIQIGWATKECLYGPEKGVGVGDYVNSCAYDGARCKKWNGPITETMNNSYGLEWGVGDVVSCLMDRHGNASFWLRGIDMGIAFEGLDLNQGWYPACSVSTEQQLRFNFGNTPFRYGSKIPAGFIPVCQISTPSVSELPEKEIHRTTVNRNNNAEVTVENIDIPKQDNGQDESYESNNSVATCDTDQSVSPPTGFNKPIVVDDSTDEVCPVLSPDDDTSMAEFGYSGIQGEECADEGTALEESVADELFGEGGEEALQMEPPLGEDSVFQPMGGGDEESHDSSRPISRQLYLSSAGEAGEESPVPSLYFEVAVSHSLNRPLILGYCTMDGHEVCAALANSDNQAYIVLPDESHTQIPIEGVTIGCGLLSPPGAIFFTIDGKPIRHLFSFSQEEAGQMPLVPYTNNPYLRINFGQDTFAYEPANQSEHRLGMSALLHDYHQSRMVALAQAR